MLRWNKEVAAAQKQVLGETGVLVPATRVYAHMRIESNGDEKIKSQGINDCCGSNCGSACFTCCKPGDTCTPDCRAWGLLQVFWPPFSGVDWQRLLTAGYNLYVGMKILASRYAQCGTWEGASTAFFSGSCADNGVVDPSNGTDVPAYLTALHKYLNELDELGVSDSGGGTGGGKPLPVSPPTGGTNTGTDGKHCLGPVCIPSLPTVDQLTAGLVQAKLREWSGTIVLTILGLGLIFLGLVRVA